ncbi:MAG: 50S ribosomal protein L11 methyltransferase [Clostridia bacterium]|nr:50S ribosomal protein L11 methyltransferase [Clostridia bacterium]MBQ9994665.1 50S ribosomal protein L11 methyltransferase [Clostridia bacterium]
MKWIAVKIYTSREGIEPVCGRLYCLGVGGVQIEDAADFEEFIETGRPHWDYIDESLEPLRTCETNVTAYLTADEAGALQLSLIREGIAAMRALDTDGAFGDLRIEIADRDDEEWANNWKQYYKPFPIGERVLVRPEWEEIEDSDGRVVLVMNPGHLFGTGTHHSTRMCLEQLEQHVKGGERVLDLGCGSGILSILALLLGAQHATAVDIDAGAPSVVGENLALNSLGDDKCRVLVGDVLDEDTMPEKPGENFDIVVANIVADVIIALSGAAYRYTRAGGTFITSGIISEREQPVADAIEAAGFVIVDRISQGGWSCLVCKKPE